MYIKKYFTISIVFFLINTHCFSQEKVCDSILFNSSNILPVDSKGIRCLSIQSSRKNTIIYTFGIWCKPCIMHINNAFSISKKYDIELYILLIDREDDEIVEKSSKFLIKNWPKAKILILKDRYGNSRSKKYKRFLKEITPKEFENLNGMSKYIVLDSNGNVKMVTIWKDNINNDWKDDSKMLKEKVIPLLQILK